jgi:4-amino-4-deoxy-L-arabinose transferase-like glycosyltransferase
MIKFLQHRPYLFWTLVGALVYIPFLGASHLFDWDEINFAESAREMLVSGDYLSVQINFLPFWEKPPLFIWLQALSFWLFSTFTDQAWVSMEFAARFPNALVGIATLCTVYAIGKKHFSATFGHLWAFAYLAAITPHVYASSGIIDPLFNLFIFLGLYFFAEFVADSKQLKNAGIAGVLIGLGMLTKGPVALLLWGLSLLVFGVLQFKNMKPQLGRLFFGACLAGLIGCVFFVSWYGLIAMKFGFGIIEDFFAYQIRLLTTGDAGHGQPFYYHALVLLFGCFPISILAMGRLGFATRSKHPFSIWMRVLFWVVLILFSLVKTKIVHYSSMCWLPLSFFAAQVLTDWKAGNWTWSRPYTIGMAVIGILFGIILSAVPFIGEHAFEFAPKIQDVFVQGNLQAPVAWSGWEKGLGFLFMGLIGFVLFRKGEVKPMPIFSLMASGILLIMAYMAIVVPKIEGYTQATPIDFYVSKVGQNVYIETVGFKSFAHLLYFQKPTGSPSAETLLAAKQVDRPAFFVMKVDVEEKFKYHPNLIFIKEENGFLFYKHR